MRTLIVGAVVTAAMVVAGCGAKAPSPEDPIGRTSPVDASSSAAPKKLGPEETVRAWVHAFNRLASAGETQALMDLTDSRCDTCDRVTGGVRQTISDGGSYRGGAWTIRRMRTVSTKSGRTVVDAAIDARAGAVRDRSGTAFRTFAADHFILEFTVGPEAGLLRVRDVVYLQ